MVIARPPCGSGGKWMRQARRAVKPKNQGKRAFRTIRRVTFEYNRFNCCAAGGRPLWIKSRASEGDPNGASSAKRIQDEETLILGKGRAFLLFLVFFGQGS
jgi:hypothetical protein